MATPALLSGTAAARAVEAGVFWSLEAGTRIGDGYRIQEKIAEGANSAVYLALDEGGRGAVALKILDPLKGADPVGRLRFEREFEILRKLSHPGIAACHRRLTDGALDVLVLEYIEGENLETRLQRSRLPVAEAVAIAVRLLDALDVCHRQGVVHRDLKPANVLLHPERGPVLVDFGVAWFSTALNLTRTGAVIGSPQYLAPESFGASLTDERADLYAIGVILFEMLTGRPVHLADSVAELAACHVSDPPPNVTVLRPEVDGALSGVVGRAIAPQPEDRFATAGEFREALLRGSVVAGRALRARIPCARCKTPLIITLPFCPGCGRGVDWEPTAGPFAVQLTSVERPGDALAWLRHRYGALLRTHPIGVEQRLKHVPVPLIVGASATTAEQLVAEAEDHGCKAEVVRARAVLGARIRGAEATRGEAIVAGVLHFVVVLALAVAVASLRLDFALMLLPPLVGLLGVAAAAWYIRRPVLVLKKRRARHPAAAAATLALGRLRTQLEALQHPRARKLAAAAVARAAPVLLGDTEGMAAGSVDDTLEALDRAVDAAGQLDAQTAHLLARPRARLAVEIDAVKLRIDTGDEEALEELRRLDAERDELADASVAHDLAAKRALEACADITSAIATRTAWQTAADAGR
ncbi:MAG: serine/threonine-protein kinase [Polyangiaceae bacterium]